MDFTKVGKIENIFFRGRPIHTFAVSDVFHTGSPESAMWEFKHGNGNFKRGDTAGLREIKRRASRHSLIHRDSFTSPHKPNLSQPGTPAEPIQDSEDRRLSSLEHCINELHNRLVRTEENNAALISRCQSLNDGLLKYQQVSCLSRTIKMLS